MTIDKILYIKNSYDTLTDYLIYMQYLEKQKIDFSSISMDKLKSISELFISITFHIFSDLNDGTYQYLLLKNSKILSTTHVIKIQLMVSYNDIMANKALFDVEKKMKTNQLLIDDISNIKIENQ
jgi:hypothetical protein